MAPKYARDMPEGFTNRIERVAIIGASRLAKFIDRMRARILT